VAKPEILIHSFLQTLQDTKKLVGLIKSGLHPYWKELFAQEATFSIFGYSFGGFSALAYLLLEPERVDRVFLFESGGFIDQIDASVLFHRRDSVAKVLWDHYYVGGALCHDWEPLYSKRESELGPSALFEEAMRERMEGDTIPKRPRALGERDRNGDFVYREPYRVLLRSDEEARELWRDVMATLYQDVELVSVLNKEERTLFGQIYLGYESVSYRRRVELQQEKILVISGGADEIFPTRKLLELGPSTGLALLQVPGITHWVKFRSASRWRQWQQLVVDVMETFNVGGSPGKT
jgi:pimeloyl-ACP methyl ester carboxylesterase